MPTMSVRGTMTSCTLFSAREKIDVKSSFALDRVKDTTALPLRQLGL